MIYDIWLKIGPTKPKKHFEVERKWLLTLDVPRPISLKFVQKI